ncbi:MAG: tRNA (N6-threonylcarbamoyladenosine(37)-N6)-methyltransferase TrmO [Paludibacteraceae bacterium]
MDSLELHIIAHAHNGFTDKFGIPRQPQSASHIETRIVFTPTYRVREALRGIEGFSHLWLIWGFSENTQTLSGFALKGERLGWSPTVRPPRLGGNKRMGVFATRSPFRPNPIGLSSVRLLRVEETEQEGLVLVVAGADLMDGTPIYDIKPYLSYSDAHVDAHNGFAEETKDYRLQVEWETPIEMPNEVRLALEEILTQDPRPAYQHNPKRLYKMDYNGYRIAFLVQNNMIYVRNIEKTTIF